MNHIIAMFDKEIESLSDLYDMHLKLKSDSWKTCDIHFLYHKLVEEINEYITSADGTKKEIEELEDMILVSLMLLNRLKKVKHINVDSLYNVIIENRRDHHEEKNNTDEKINKEE